MQQSDKWQKQYIAEIDLKKNTMVNFNRRKIFRFSKGKLF